jgi:hypothetical protein
MLEFGPDVMLNVTGNCERGLPWKFTVAIEEWLMPTIDVVEDAKSQEG